MIIIKINTINFNLLLYYLNLKFNLILVMFLNEI